MGTCISSSFFCGTCFCRILFFFPPFRFRFFPTTSSFFPLSKRESFSSLPFDWRLACVLTLTDAKEGKVRTSVFLSANTPENHTLFLLGRKVFSPMWQTRLCEGGGRRGERGENGLGKHGSGNMQASSWNSLRQVVPGIKFANWTICQKNRGNKDNSVDEFRTPLCLNERSTILLHYLLNW